MLKHILYQVSYNSFGLKLKPLHIRLSKRKQIKYFALSEMSAPQKFLNTSLRLLSLDINTTYISDTFIQLRNKCDRTVVYFTFNIVPHINLYCLII